MGKEIEEGKEFKIFVFLHFTITDNHTMLVGN